MQNIIEKLLKHFECGTLTRRELMQGLALLAAGSAAAAPAETTLQGVSINHVSILSSNIQRAGDWYTKMFNLSRLDTKEENNYMVGLGKSHISIHPVPRGKTPGTIDHFCIGLDKFNEAAVIEELKRRGANPQGLHVKDPDGLSVQLNSIDGHA
jgi:catechol 2,3-dioxygenase-like lactoylglutathione lyase family enzyme